MGEASLLANAFPHGGPDSRCSLSEVSLDSLSEVSLDPDAEPWVHFRQAAIMQSKTASESCLTLERLATPQKSFTAAAASAGHARPDASEHRTDGRETLCHALTGEA